MTKKNVAALMLAGAMMTVGSGAMADTIFGKGGETLVESKGSVSVPVEATAEDTVKVTVSWTWDREDATPNFEFEWVPENHNWKAKASNVARIITFSAQNDGSTVKNITLAKSTTGNPDWADINTTDLEGKNTSVGVGQTGMVAGFSVDAKKGASDVYTDKPINDNLSFEVTIADVVSGN